MQKILIVDDAAIIRLLFKNILLEAGYEIEEASCGNDAINKYKKKKPDLVIMDIIMPEIDGIVVVKIIRNLDPKAKIIMCTTLSQKKLVVEAFYAGAVNYIIKPFVKDKVIEVVKKVIG